MNSKENKYSSNISLNGNKNKKPVKKNNDLKSENNSYQKNKHQHRHHSKHHHQSNESIGDIKSKVDSNDMNVSTLNLRKHKQSSFTGRNDKLKYRRTKLTQIDVNSSNYAEIIRLTTLLDEAYAKIKDLSSENKKLMNNQRVQERALKNTSDMVGDYPKTVEKLMEEIRVLKAQNKKYAEKLVSVERQQAKKTAIQNSQDTNYELKEKNHRLIEELEKQKQKLQGLEKRDENYQKVYDQLVKRTKLCKEKIAENKLLVQKNQRLEKDIVKLRESYEILKKKFKLQNNNSSTDKSRKSLSKLDMTRNEFEMNSKDSDSLKKSTSLGKKVTQENMNKTNKDMSSNSNNSLNREVIKKPKERQPKTLKLKPNLKKEDSNKNIINDPGKNNSDDTNKNDNNKNKNNNNNNNNIGDNSNDNDNNNENYDELYSDDFDAIEDEDQKFFMPSQEESLKPSTLFKPNLYYSANCSPEPGFKENNKDNLCDNDMSNEQSNDNEIIENDNSNINTIDDSGDIISMDKSDDIQYNKEKVSKEVIKTKNEMAPKKGKINTNMITDTLLTNNNETNNGVSLFEDNYDIDFYNDYAEDNMKLNDSVLNIDEYIDKDNHSKPDNDINNDNNDNEDKNDSNDNDENEEINENDNDEVEDINDNNNNNNNNSNPNENDDSLSMNNYEIDD
ncbi:hypothetical protein PIROE2DRAFT_10156 [Piromyces sp. E2]|nr:hypothetical protein PIROE2DRAFT_10156 [Piromyces sp. E2]|eukprot:OUM63315.1 hypothetical protein PIROE2DRAFT_10156 [Piromyces sp. E2]